MIPTYSKDRAFVRNPEDGVTDGIPKLTVDMAFYHMHFVNEYHSFMLSASYSHSSPRASWGLMLYLLSPKSSISLLLNLEREVQSFNSKGDF